MTELYDRTNFLRLSNKYETVKKQPRVDSVSLPSPTPHAFEVILEALLSPLSR